MNGGGDYFFKIVGILVLLAFFFYISTGALKIQNNLLEGFVQMTNTTSPTTSTGEPSTNAGIAGSSGNIANAVGEQTIKMQDTFLIKKYRKNYENLVINTDEYVSYLMVDNLLKLKTDDSEESKKENIAILDNINKLSASKTSLNGIMKFVDSV
jgi:hypothetical protein